MGQKKTSSNAHLFAELSKKILYLDEKHRFDVEQAFEVADQAHIKQKRKTGEPYITHPLAVACILADMRMDNQTLMAGLLHDTIEDTDVTKASLAKVFGSEVALLVDGVSKLEHIHFDSRLEANAEYLRKMLLAMSKDIRVIIVKLADRLHNMRTIKAMAPDKRAQISRETLDIYAPIARRLGMADICLELENLGFQELYPMRYRVLKLAMEKNQGQHSNYLHDIIAKIHDKFAKKNLGIISLNAREKHLYSIYKKMRRKGITFYDVNDVFGIRVIVVNKEACYLALCYIHEIFRPISGRFKDYIAMPKPNGYQSLHTVLFGPNGNPIEVQIKTEKMSKVAQTGLCSHWAYKSQKKNINMQELNTQQWVQSLIELQTQTGNSEDFLENVKINLIPDEVYVFTPKGEIIELPAGATIIDMAYAIHTEIGNHCVAAKVDRQLVPLSAPLNSGATVEIITSPTAFPNLSYLGFVVTPKAKNSIRNYFKTKKRDQAYLLGSKLLESALMHSIAEYDEAKQHSVANELGFANIRELLINVGLGYKEVNNVAEFFRVTETVKNCIAANDEGALPISGAEGLVLSYAECCYPIPGDPIVGYMQQDQGIVLHHKDCRHNRSLDPDLEVPVYWSGMVVGAFKTSITIYSENKQGLLATMALAIAEQKASIEDIKIIPSSSSTIDINMIIMVSNRQHLAKIFAKLRLIKQVYRVKRNYLGD